MISSSDLLVTALFYWYVIQFLLLGNVYRCFWKAHREDQSWLIFVMLFATCFLWPIVIPIAYVRLLEMKFDKEL